MIIRTTRRALLGAGAGLLAMPFAADAAAGRMMTLVGTGAPGTATDGQSAAEAQINNPYGVLIGLDGHLYWADFGTDRVLGLDLKTRRVFVVAGTGVKGHAGDGGPAGAAQLAAPHEVRFDRAGNMVIAERDANVVRHVDRKTGIISTIVGTGEAGFGGDGGPSTQALLHQPHSIALDRDDNLFICDIMNNRVRRRDAMTGLITTFAGTGDTAATPDEAPLAGTSLHGPRSIDIAPDGTLFLVLREGNQVFAIDPARQTLKRLAGTGEKGYSGDGGPALGALFNGPKGIAFSADGSVYISDTENHVIRRVPLAQRMIATVAGIGRRGDGPVGDPLACGLSRPHGVSVHGRNVYIGDAENHRIRVMRI